MRIYGTSSTARNAAAAPRRAASGSFSIIDADSAPSSAPVASLRTIGGIDALMALQGVDDPAARRSRGVKRGRLALDALDELKAGLLTGNLDQSTLLRLKASAAELQDASGDAGLDAVLAEIELRVAVEIAKLAPR
ncbi:MAG: flagellar assembly protein FliX [Pseudorhodoplanes sp.]